MHLDLWLSVAGLFVGSVVGATGMGGGALVTPMLVLVFGVQPLAAVSSDLVASLFMKPVGAVVHLRRRTVNLRMVDWLSVGSVPAAFAGVLLLRLLGDGHRVQDGLRLALGAAILLAVAAMVAKSALLARRDRVTNDGRVDGSAGGRAGGPAGEPEQETGPASGPSAGSVRVKPVATVLVGVVGGLAVGMTSVGSGSLVVAMLLLLHPRLRAGHLVGTDLTQAIPLVGAAAVAHLLFGDVQAGVTASLLLGAVPGVWLGARVSSRHAAAGWVRPVLWLVLVGSGLSLLRMPPDAVVGACGALGAVLLGAAVRRRVRSGARTRLTGKAAVSHYVHGIRPAWFARREGW